MATEDDGRNHTEIFILEICDSKIDRNHTPLCKSELELAEQSAYAVVCCPLLICLSFCLYH